MKGYVIEKEFEHKGLKCVVLLLAIGHRCGYVGVPKEHPLYNVDEMNCLSDFSCHGGLTYSGGGENSSYPISSDLWWFGFDCAHCGDEPDWNSTLKAFPEQYNQIYQQKMIGKMFHSEWKIRTTEYVENECKALAEQLANYEGYKTSSDEQEGVVKQYYNENKDTVERYYNENNELGVLYSPDYGSGWSSWNSPELAYDKRIVEYWLNKHPNAQKMKMHLERIGYHDVRMGGYNDLKIAWIPKGTIFYIDEYDGSESIETAESCGMMTA